MVTMTSPPKSMNSKNGFCGFTAGDTKVVSPDMKAMCVLTEQIRALKEEQGKKTNTKQSLSSPPKSMNSKNGFCGFTAGNTKVVSPDMKAMCVLTEQIRALKEEQGKKTKQSRLTKYLTSPPKHSSYSSLRKQYIRIKQQGRKKSLKSASNENGSSKKSISNWLRSGRIEGRQDAQLDRDINMTSPQEKLIGVKGNMPISPSKNLVEVKSKAIKGLNKNSSFLKYGIKVPSFDEIIKEQKKTQEYKKCIEDMKLPSFTESEENSEHQNKTNKRQVCAKLLDCKHLSFDEIQRAVKEHMSYLRKIYSGEQYSERHEAFCKQQYQNLNDYDLRYNTSTITFSYEQNRLMLKMFENEFGDDIPYFFMVLLPELCLKIFMEEHNMSYSEAIKYLEECPIDDDSDVDCN